MAQELKEYLETFAISGFVAHSDIEPSLEWQAEIELALRTCDAFIALLTPEFHKSFWTDQEVGFAICRDIPVFPVGLDIAILPYGFLQKYQAVPFNGVEKLAEKVFSRLLKNEKTQMKMSNAVLNYLAASRTYIDSNNRSKLITINDFRWDEKLIQTLKQILAENNQVSGASTTSARIQRIIREFGTKIKSSKKPTLEEVFSGTWINNYRHHSGRRKSERVEIKDKNKYYADGKLVFTIDQVKVTDEAKKVKFRKTRIRDRYNSTVDLVLIAPYVYSGSEKAVDGISEIEYKRL